MSDSHLKSDTKTHVSCGGCSVRAWMLLVAVVVAGVIVDLASKAWAFRDVTLHPETIKMTGVWYPPPDSSVPLLPWRLLDMQLVMNFGAVFGLGEHQRFFFIAFTIAALLAGLIIFARLAKRNHTFAQVALGMVIAGGIGNLYDRWYYGAVRDFLHMLPGRPLPNDWTWPGGSTEMFPWVFNVADMLLLFGMLMLMLHMRRVDAQRRAARLNATDPAATAPAPAES